MNNRVIQVYSPSRGGSTFISFMLVNGERGIAPGDISFLFRPQNENHKRTSCVCPDQDCSIWSTMKEAGEENFYTQLFDMGYGLIVDSSKRQEWYNDQKEYYNGNIQDLIIFKSPAEHGRSYFKRIGKLNLSHYVHYYLKALKNTNDPVLVEYSDLAQNTSETLEKVCNKLDLKYFNGKEFYWEKDNWHTWGGSNTAMIHFFEEGSHRYKLILEDMKGNRGGIPTVSKHHREIYYSNSGDKLPDWGYQHIDSENGLQELYQYMQKLKV